MIYVLFTVIILALVGERVWFQKQVNTERVRLLDRIMARSYEQFQATPPDSFLSQPDPEPRRRLYDSTGLLEVDTDPDEPED